MTLKRRCKLIPLIDADILRYEIASCGQFKDDDGELQIRDFDFVARLLDEKVEEICSLVWGTEPPILFLTSDSQTHKRLNRRRVKEKKQPKVYQPNFRDKVAISKPYKGTRKNPRPYHYDNITAYIMANYEINMAEGREADDNLATWQTRELKRHNGTPTTIICTRDKDLRQVEGLHFGWQCGRQPQFGPHRVDRTGSLSLSHTGKIQGTGFKFFGSQLLTGDATDNIPGLRGVGPKRAYTILQDLDTERAILFAIKEEYVRVHGVAWDVVLLEQALLLWMIREVDIQGQPIMYELPRYLYEEDVCE